MNSPELKEAKRQLYGLLRKKMNLYDDSMTEIEAEICQRLGMDDDVNTALRAEFESMINSFRHDPGDYSY